MPVRGSFESEYGSWNLRGHFKQHGIVQAQLLHQRFCFGDINGNTNQVLRLAFSVEYGFFVDMQNAVFARCGALERFFLLDELPAVECLFILGAKCLHQMGRKQVAAIGTARVGKIDLQLQFNGPVH